MGTYLAGAGYIFKIERFKADTANKVNAFIFMASFVFKLVIQILMLTKKELFRDQTATIYLSLLDYFMNNVVILNLYYFTYTMMSVHDTLEAKSPPHLEIEKHKTKIMGIINIGMHAFMVVGAAFVFVFAKGESRCEDI